MVVPDKIQSLGASTYANLYGGLVVINSGASYQVFLTKLDPAVEAAFVSAAGGANLQFHRTAQSQRSQYAAQAKLMAHMSQLGSDGVDILDIIPEVRTGRLIVDVLASKSTMSSATIGGANAIRALLGSASAALVDTHATTSNSLTTETGLVESKTMANPSSTVTPNYVGTLARNNDSTPWFTGEPVYHKGEGGCTTAFAVNLPSGATNLLTASHCFLTGQSVQNGFCCPYYTPGNSFPDSQTVVGTVSKADTRTSGGFDVELINANGAGALFVGPPLSTQAESVTGGPHASYVGYQICNDGAYSGDECAITVQAVHTSRCVSDAIRKGENRCYYENEAYANDEGGIANEEGDSGGPVIKTANGLLYALGVVNSGSNLPQEPTHCDYTFDNTEKCYSILFYTDITNATKDMGVTLDWP